VSKILIVDDDRPLAEVVAATLRRHGHDVQVAAGGLEALAIIKSGEPDVMLLDYVLPDIDGAAVLDALRAPDGSIPIPVMIFTGGRTTPSDQVYGLRKGAIDYIDKGITGEVLLARIDNAVRFSPNAARRGRLLELGSLTLDMKGMRATVSGRDVELENRHWGLLTYLAQRPGTVVSRAELLENVWGTNYPGFQHAVDQAVYEVRRRLGDPGWIETVRRRGYRFAVR
jgi:two-component system OmpR family response regulator